MSKKYRNGKNTKVTADTGSCRAANFDDYPARSDLINFVMLYLYCTSYKVILYEFTFRDIISPQIIYTILITIQFLHLV